MEPDSIDSTAAVPEVDLLEGRLPADPPTTDSLNVPAAVGALAPDAAVLSGGSAAGHADRLAERALVPVHEYDQGPHQAASSRSPTSHPLVDVAIRVHADFAQHATLAEVLTVIDGCRRDLDTTRDEALPELVERLARQRLVHRLEDAESHRGPRPTGM
jgi:hypothetical protein